jgi:hypothetical protein
VTIKKWFGMAAIYVSIIVSGCDIGSIGVLTGETAVQSIGFNFGRLLVASLLGLDDNNNVPYRI